MERTRYIHVRHEQPDPHVKNLHYFIAQCLFHSNFPRLTVCSWARLDKVQQHWGGGGRRGWTLLSSAYVMISDPHLTPPPGMANL